VRAQGVESASLPAAVIFRPVNQPPKLIRPLTDQAATVGKVFTYAIPADSFADPEGEGLTYSAGRFNSSLPLPSWLRFEETSRRFTGKPAFVDFMHVNVSARDPVGLAVSGDFTIHVSSAASLESGLSTLQKTIMAALISGGIGIGFAVVQACLKRAANRKLLHALGVGDDYDRNVVTPIARDIARRIKITGFLNSTTNKQMMGFKSAVRSLLSALDQRGVDLNLSQMTDVKRDAVINEIGRQVEHWVREHRQGCAAYCPGLTTFFKPQLNPDSLADAASEIANKIVQARNGQGLSAGPPVSSSPVYKELEDKRSLELSEIDSPSKKGVELEEQDPAVVQFN
jgi:hypothetical protein